ncbi:MAG: lipocalin-like domain-containing protein [Acidobacteriota bacterium]|nr:lipocalin-like domain-containing protein [Acidobacteriota bacterium]
MKKRIVGTWRLISIEGEPSVNRAEHNPTGYLVYDSTGHMSAQITYSDTRQKFASTNPSEVTAREKAEAYDSYVAYYGTYTINMHKRVITHHVEGSLNPNDVGNDLIRYFEFSGERLILSPTRLLNGKLAPKDKVKRNLIWERLE